MSDSPDMHVRSTSVADLCAAECVMQYGVILILAVIYVSPNNKITDIQEFIHRALFEYFEDVYRTLSRYNKNLLKLSLTLAGDFNINFSSDEAQTLISFLENVWLLLPYYTNSYLNHDIIFPNQSRNTAKMFTHHSWV